MTKDLAGCIHGIKNVTPEHYLSTNDFMEALDSRLKKEFA